MSKKIFVNFPVKDLEKSKEFFTKLGFSFNPQFTDANAACLVISEEINSMLIVEKTFLTFMSKQIADTTKFAESITAITLNSKEEVDALLEKALNAGAKEYRDVSDTGWMYARSFEDLDGHLWEFFFMDTSARQKS